MTGRTRRPTRARQIAWRLAVLTATAAGAWTLASALTTGPAHADTPPAAEAALADVTALVEDVLPPDAAATAVAVIEEVGQGIGSTTQPGQPPAQGAGEEPISYADPGHEVPLQDPSVAEPIPTPTSASTPTPQSTGPAKRPPAPRPTRTALHASTPTAPTTSSRAPAKRGNVDDDRTTKQGGGAPLRSYPDCGPKTAAGGHATQARIPPSGAFDADLTGGWLPPDLASIRMLRTDVYLSGLTLRPGAPPG